VTQSSQHLSHGGAKVQTFSFHHHDAQRQKDLVQFDSAALDAVCSRSTPDSSCFADYYSQTDADLSE